MTLHLLKLSVGSESINDLEDWISRRQQERLERGEGREHVHVTRMVPRRIAELLSGGSMFWVIRGAVAARQPLVDVQPFTDAQGIGRCRLLLEPQLRPVVPRPCRPFQGWRYLQAHEAPDDLAASDLGMLPEELRRELAELCLL